MVGTPGVDTSAGRAFESATDSLGTVGKNLYSVAEADYRAAQLELRQKQAEQRAAMKELQNLQYENNAAGAAAETDIALNEIDNRNRQKFQWDTSGGMEAFNAEAQKVIQDKLDGITDPKQKLMTEKLLQSRLASKTQQFADYLNSRVPDIGKANTQKIGDALRLSTNNSGLSVVDVQKKLEDFKNDPANQKAFYNVYGPAWEAEMRKYQSDAARNYLAKTAELGDLNVLNERIDKFSNIVEGTDAEEFYSRQRAMAQQVKVKAEQEQEFQTSVEANEMLSDIRDKASRDELTQTDVDTLTEYVKTNKGAPGMIRAANSALQQQNSRLLRQAKTDAEKVVTEQDKEAKRQTMLQVRKELNSEFNNIIGKDKGKVGPRKTTLDGKPVTPRMLSELYANIDQAEIDGNISADSAKAMRTQVGLAMRTFNKKEPQAALHAQNLMRDSDQLMKWARKATENPQVNKVFGVKLNNVYMDEVARLERKTGKLSTAQQRRNILEALWPKLLKEARTEYDEQQRTRKQRVQAETEKRQKAK
jgi:hypothetical protein